MKAKSKKQTELLPRARKRFLSLVEGYDRVEVKTLREIMDNMYEEKDKQAFQKAVRALGFSWDDIVVLRRS